jgi:putative tryptophan/tyrosine transport system substrate-binding protein
MRRREFIAATAALLASPSHSRAQGKPRRIGYLGNFECRPNLGVWRGSLRENGWIEGKNLLVEYRYAQFSDRMPALAAELIALTPDLVIASGPQAAIALKSATATIPIVFVAVFDPVGLGLVQSLSRPSGNITGLATYVPGDWVAKRIEILREIVPPASKIAILVNPGNPMHRLILAEEVPSTAQRLGVMLPIVEATTAEELDIAFASAAAQHADAIIVFADPLTNLHAPRIIALAAEHQSALNPSLQTIRQRWIDRIRPRHSRSMAPCGRLRR